MTLPFVYFLQYLVIDAQGNTWSFLEYFCKLKLQVTLPKESKA